MEKSIVDIVLLGGQGQVGQSLVIENNKLAKPHHLVALSHQDADITNLNALTHIIQQHKPDLIINAAAFTHVDKAERAQKLAFAVNVTGPNNIATLCHQHQIPLIHYSTDYVFDGKKGTPYVETDLPSPCNYYGKTKYLGEQAIHEQLKTALILRVSGVFSPVKHNFVKAILKAAKNQETLRVVADQFAAPTSANRIAQTTLTLAKTLTTSQQYPWNIYHYTSSPLVSWYDFACYCIKIARIYTTLKVKTIEPISTDAYGAIAPRALRTELDCRKIKAQWAVDQPHWQDDVEHMIKAYYQHETNFHT